MTGAIETRLARLEHDAADGGELTKDERNIEDWELARMVAEHAEMPAELREKCKRLADEIEADILAQAAQIARPGYARHLDWCRSMWRKRTGKDDYVPALTGAMNGMGEYEDWDAPNVMQRRAALRARPDIQRLIGATHAAGAEPAH